MQLTSNTEQYRWLRISRPLINSEHGIEDTSTDVYTSFNLAGAEYTCGLTFHAYMQRLLIRHAIEPGLAGSRWHFP
jgi:hypothetical protein